MALRICPTDLGVSLFVGTVSRDGVPSGCRAVAATSTDDLKSLTIYLPLETSRDVIADIAVTKRIALAASHPPTHHTVQLKGVSTGVRLADDSEAEMIRTRFDAFVEVLHAIGIPRRVARSVNQWPAFAVDMKVEEIFEQTPGPNAGTPIR